MIIDITKNEFICDSLLMLQLIERLERATREHKIFWQKDSANKFRINSTCEHNSLNKFAISFSNKDGDDEASGEAVTIYVDKVYKIYSPERNNIVFEASKRLEKVIHESKKCAESILHEMIDTLSNIV